jgi:acetylornithine deacetylase
MPIAKGGPVQAPDAAVQESARGGDPVALTRAMVTIPSVNPELEEGGEGEEAMARQCSAWLEGWGYAPEQVEVAPGRWNVVARRAGGGGEGRTLLLNGHLDTVGVVGMTSAPFSGEARAGRVWGRGACDMKGGLGLILATAAELARSPHPGELVVALTADEEHASVGMEALVRAGVQADGAVVCEPTGLAVMPAHKGFLWLEAEFRGRAAHGSRPDLGVDAILHAARFLSALEPLGARLREGPPHPLLAHASFHAGTIRGGSAPSVYPDRCHLVLERRTLPGEDPSSVLQEFIEVLDRVRAASPDLDATLQPGLFRPGTEVSGESHLVRTLLQALEDEGVQRSMEGMTAWVDAAYLNEAGVPAVCFGPGSIAQAHGAEEWVPIAELETGARVLSRFARSFLARGESQGPLSAGERPE